MNQTERSTERPSHDRTGLEKRCTKDNNCGPGSVLWARQDLNLRPIDYESTALTN